MLIMQALTMALSEDRRLEGTDALMAMAKNATRDMRRGCVAIVLLKSLMNFTLPAETQRHINQMIEEMTKSGADFSFMQSAFCTPPWVTGAFHLAAWGDSLPVVVVTGTEAVVKETLRRIVEGDDATPVTEGEA